MNEDHADALEAREKAGVDVPVEGMLPREERIALRIDPQIGVAMKFWRVWDSHDICERALRDAQAQLSDIRKAVDVHGGLSLFPMVEAVAHLAKANRANQADLNMAEKRITALEKALHLADFDYLPDTTWVCIDGSRCCRIGAIRQALAQQPPQATAEPKEAK